MATLGAVFGGLKDFLLGLGAGLTPKDVPAGQKHLQEPLQKFLFGFEWLGNGGSHHRRALYNAAKEAMYFEFMDGKIYTVEQFTLAEAIAYWSAASKGQFYWQVVRVRGKGNAKKTRKPYHPGMG